MTIDKPIRPTSLNLRQPFYGEASTAPATDTATQTDGDNEDEVDFSQADERRGEYTKGLALFYVQTFIISVIVISCIVNLSLQNGDVTVFSSLLSTSLGILLPQPGFNIKRIKKLNTSDIDERLSNSTDDK